MCLAAVSAMSKRVALGAEGSRDVGRCDGVLIQRCGPNGGVRMAKTRRLDGERLRELARIGAEGTLRRLRAEIVAIERAFPELKLPARRRQVRRALQRASTKTRTMSAEARRAVSERMKRYWAERRKAKAKVK